MILNLNIRQHCQCAASNTLVRNHEAASFFSSAKPFHVYSILRGIAAFREKVGCPRKEGMSTTLPAYDTAAKQKLACLTFQKAVFRAVHVVFLKEFDFH